MDAQPPADVNPTEDIMPIGTTTKLANGQPDDKEPKTTPFITPEIARRHPTKIPQASQIPKKGILKNTNRAKSSEPFPIFSANKDPAVGSIRATVSYTLADAFFKLPNATPRPTVGFTEKHSVAIIGDTSDEYESDGRKSFSLPTPSKLLPRIPETMIVEPPKKMVSEPDMFLTTEESDSATERSQEDSKITEGRSTDDLCSTTEDDLVSISSSTCSSHIAGKWWNGKDNRYVVHCEKKGCKHRHGSPKINDGYLTPTQRSNREITTLKNEIKKLNSENGLKEIQLVELRDRIKQIDGANELSHDNKLMKLLDQKSQKFEHEKELLKESGQTMANQLSQQIFELKNQLATKQAKIEKLELELLKPHQDVSTMTDFVEMEELQFPGSDQTTLSSGSVVHTPNDPNPTINFLNVAQKSVSVQQSPSFASVPAQIITIDAMTEAYRQEALFFRTKASELELIVREHILRNDLLVNDEVQTLGQAEAELPGDSNQLNGTSDDGRMKRTLTHSMSLMSVSGGNYGTLAAIKRQQSVVAGECQSQACSEKLRRLMEENDSILEKMDDQFVKFSELEEELLKTKEALEAEQKANAVLKENYEELSNLANERLAESISSQRAFQKLQEKTEQLEKAVTYLEDRCQAYQNTILDHGLVVRGEETKEWRRGFEDPRFKVFFSKDAQTELTGQELSANESEYSLLHIQLRQIQKEYREKQFDLDAQFTEIETNLTLKSKLVEQLTKQMEISARDTQLIEEHRQKERDYYKDRIEEMSKELERLPSLQMETERAQQQKSLLEIELRTIKERYEDGLDEALNEALKKYRDQEEYWADKVQNLERSRGDVKNILGKLQLDFEELKMRAQLERTELEQRLASSIEHVAVLNQQLNPPRRDVACEAKPKTTNKYVACRPNHRHKCIEVDRKELEPSESDLNVAELVKYKEALLRARRKLSDLNPPKAPPRPPRPTIRIDEEPELEIESETQKQPDFVFKGLKKSKVSRSQLSFGQVYFDRKDGVKLPILRRYESDEEEDNHDTISFMSLPAVMDYQRSLDDSELSHQASTQTPIEEESDEEESVPKKPKSVNIDEQSSSESATPLAEQGIRMEVEMDERIRSASEQREHSIEDIRNLDQHTRQLEDEIHKLRRQVAKANEIEDKLEKIENLLPPIRHIGKPPKERKSKKSEHLDALLKNVVNILKDSKLEEPKIRRSASMSNLNEVEKSPYLVRPCLQLNAKLKQKSPPRIKPLPIPTKWDNERSELLKQNAHYAAQLLALKAKLGNINTAERTELDRVEDELRELADQMTTLPEQHIKKLAKTKKDRDNLFMENLELQMKLQDALNELEIYRIEPREEARERLQTAHLPKSRSAESLTHSGGPKDLKRWKEAAGVSFRELNHLRKLCNEMDKEKKEMQIQVAIMKGETELTKCQMAMASEWAARKLVMGRRGSQRSFPVEKLSKRKGSTGQATDNLLTVDATSMPDLLKLIGPSTPTDKPLHKGSIPDDLDKKSIDDFFLDSPLQQELRRAFQKQLSGLREKNKELEGRVDDLEGKIAINNKELIKVEEHATIVAGLNERIEILKQETEMYENKIREIESERQEMLLVMFQKGQQAAQHDIDEDKRLDEMTEDRVVLKFLHDAFYYYLLSKGDSREHLQAIMTILNFTSKQKDEIFKRRGKSQ